MTKQKLLYAVAAAAMLTATGNAYAQQQEHRGAGVEKAAPHNAAPGGIGRPSGPAAQNNVRPSGPAGQNRNETTGQAPHENAVQEKIQERAPQSRPNENAVRQNNANEERANTRNRDERRNNAQQERQERQERTGQNNRQEERLNRNNERPTTGQSNEGRNGVNGRNETNERSTTTNENRTNENRTGANENRTGASVNLTAEQRTRVHDVIVGERGAPRVANVNFPLTVGTVVPRDVRIVALPPRIVEIEPAWRGFEYFLVGDEIVVVNPYDLHIVAVIPA
jgi:hypothetical protein